MVQLWLIISLLAQCNAKELWGNKDDKLAIFDEIQAFTNVIVSSYFSTAHCIGIITEGPSNFLNIRELPVLYITHTDNNDSFEALMLMAMDAGCLAFVVQVSDMKSMVETFSELFHSPKSLYRENRRYLFLPNFVKNAEDSWEIAMDDVFSSKPMNWMPDLLIVKLTIGREALIKINTFNQMDSTRKDINTRGRIQISKKTKCLLEVYTHRFVGKTPYGKVILDVWVSDHGFLYSKDLFPNKLHDLMGKELKMTGIPYPPFSVMILDSEPPIFDGLEFQVMFEFGKKHNVTWKVIYDSENWWGEIWDNGSGNGLLGAVADDRVDFAFSAIYLWYREFFYIDYSVCHYRSGLTTVTPKPKMLPAWLIPVRPFNSYMWGAVLAAVIIVTVTLYIISRCSHAALGGGIASRYSTIVECSFRTAGLLVLQVPEDERDYSTPRYAPLRHLVTWFTLFFVVVSSAYGGGLSAILTLPQFQPPIDTAKDLANSGLHWYAFDEAYVFFLQSSTDPVMQTLTRNFVVRSENELVKHAFDDIALVAERLQGGHFADVKYLFEEMMQDKRIMKEDLVFGHCVYAFRKGSPYKENLNLLLYKLREAGVQIYWEGMTVRKFLSQRRQQSVIDSRIPPEVQRTKLAFSHVQGTFYLLVLGLFLALVTFILEFLTFSLVEKQNREANGN